MKKLNDYFEDLLINSMSFSGVREANVGDTVDPEALITLFESFEQAYIADNLQKLFLGQIGEISFYTVNGDFVKRNAQMEFVEGGNWMVYPQTIPENEIWIDNDLNHQDYAPIALHEYIESWLMVNEKLEYEDAHEFANKMELQYRDRHKV
jgi:hypothetical protein